MERCTTGVPPYSTYYGPLPYTYNCGLRMRWECSKRFPRHRDQMKPLVSDPRMHHGTCDTHVPWCMSQSLTRSGSENVLVFPAQAQSTNLRIWQEAPGKISSIVGWQWLSPTSFLSILKRLLVLFSFHHWHLFHLVTFADQPKIQTYMSIKDILNLRKPPELFVIHKHQDNSW